MKKLLLTIALIAAGFMFNAAAQDPEAPDTVKVIENADKVTVSRIGDTTTIQVEKENKMGSELFSYKVTVEDEDESVPDTDWEFEVPFGIGKDKKKHSGSNRLRTSFVCMGHGYMGQRFNYYNKGNIKNSIEVGFREVVGLKWSRGVYSPAFSIGLGVGTQYYKAQDGFAFGKEGSGLIVVPVAEGCNLESTSLAVFNFQVPLMFTLPIGRDVKFTLGGVAYFNSYAKAETVVSIGKDRYKTRYKGLQQRLFTGELTCGIGVCDILGVYASWSPMTLFQAPYGPQLKSWSIGGVINF